MADEAPLSEPDPLRQMQAWLQSVIMHPGGVLAGVRGAPAQQIFPAAAADLESVIEPSRQLSSEARLEIYSRAYFARLCECLQAEFLMLSRAVGEDLFVEFAAEYLAQFPSQSYTLGQLGARFVQFLRDTRTAAAAPLAEPWPACLIELAELEWNFNEVFDGPGSEDEPSLDAQALQQLTPTAWMASRWICAPDLRLLHFTYPAHEYWRALRADPETLPPAPRETWLAVHRRAYAVRHQPLSPLGYAILSALMAGESIGDALAGAENLLPPDADEAAPLLGQLFAGWAAEGFFLRPAA
jgi:hypothetical protein